MDMQCYFHLLQCWGAFGLFLWTSNNTPSADQLNVAYLTGKANLRTCPSIACQSSAVYSEGQQVVVLRTVRGQNALDTDKWAVVRFGNSERYINSYFVSTSPSYFTTFWGYVSVFLIVLMPLFMVAVSSTRLQRRFASGGSKLDILLLGFTLAIGIVLVGVAYLYSVYGRQSNFIFLSNTFGGLGAGLVGAAITFGLFQSLLSKRIIDAQEPDRKLNDIGMQVEALTHHMATINQKLSPEVNGLNYQNQDGRRTFNFLEKVRFWRGSGSGSDK